MTGILKTLWLDGHYKQAITYAKTLRKNRGKVESIRLVIAGRPQRRALQPTQAEWETYMVHVFPEDAIQYIDGFILRIRKR